MRLWALILALGLVSTQSPSLHAQILSVPSPPERGQKSGSPETRPAQDELNPQAEVQKPEDDQPKRLILKDGSYQPAVRWEDKGDRIRYLSAERFQWEELPKDLVDWEATEKYYRKTNPTPDMKREAEAKAKAEAAAEKEEELRTDAELDQTNPEVAPGLRLPDGKGVYLLDVFRSKPQLAEMIQNDSKLNADRGKNILRAAINPLAKNKQKIELDGTRARIHAHIPDPIIYLNIDDEQAANDQDLSKRFQIARLKIEKRNRVVGVIEFAFYSGTSQKAEIVPATVTRVGDTPWIEVKPTQAMPPGEYAVVEMIGDQGKDVNLYVWDFGIDPAAPENPPQWAPDKPKEKKDDKSLLEKILRVPSD